MTTAKSYCFIQDKNVYININNKTAKTKATLIEVSQYFGETNHLSSEDLMKNRKGFTIQIVYTDKQLEIWCKGKSTEEGRLVRPKYRETSSHFCAVLLLKFTSHTPSMSQYPTNDVEMIPFSNHTLWFRGYIVR